MINLETPKKFRMLVDQAHQVARQIFRPNSRRYDRAEHLYPRELDMLGALLDGMNAGGGGGEGAGAAGVRRSAARSDEGNRNSSNLSTVLGTMELCWGDVGFLLTMPRQGLGNSAIASVATDEQLERFKGKWAAMAITEPGCGSDSAAIRTTARLDGDHYVLNGEKIYVTAGDRADLVVVWATLDRNLGRAAIKSFVVEWGTPGMELVRLDHKLGIRASDTAHIVLSDCRVPAENLLGREGQGFAMLMDQLQQERLCIAVGSIASCRRALDDTLEYVKERQAFGVPIAQHQMVQAMLAEMAIRAEATELLYRKAAWNLDNGVRNPVVSSLAKAYGADAAMQTAVDAVQVFGGNGYVKEYPVEKLMRDAKVLQIYEGTSQIQRLVIAKNLLS